MKLLLLQIQHKHGDNHSLHATRESLDRELYQYVSDEWDDGISRQYGPLRAHSADQAVEIYFACWQDALDGERYEIHQLDLPEDRTLMTALKNLVRDCSTMRGNPSAIENIRFQSLPQAQAAIGQFQKDYPLNHSEEARHSWAS